MVKLFRKNSNLCDHNPPTLQTYRQTDDMRSQYRALQYSASRGKNALKCDTLFLQSVIGSRLSYICNIKLSATLLRLDTSYTDNSTVTNYETLYSVSPKKSPPAVFWHFFPNWWEFFNQFSHTFYTFLSTLDDTFLFNYLQLWRSYAILSATTQRIFTFH